MALQRLLYSKRFFRFISAVTLTLAMVCFFTPLLIAQTGSVKSYQKISQTEGGFTGPLTSWNQFGCATANLGDVDGDGVSDMAVGGRWDDDGGNNRGAVWILFLNANGTVKSEVKISDTVGNFSGVLDNDDNFGFSVAGIGDLDGDLVPDLAVGAPFDDDGDTDQGAVWILFLNDDGTVKSHVKISEGQNGFAGVLDRDDEFGFSVADLGDIDGDTVDDIGVGAINDDDVYSWGPSAPNRGAVWILFMNTNGTVKSHAKISDAVTTSPDTLKNNDNFGSSITVVGDLNGDTKTDIAVGAYQDDDKDGGINDYDRGAVWILNLNSNGSVDSWQKISDTEGNFSGDLDGDDFFGRSVASLGDLDRDGVNDLAVGANQDDDDEWAGDFNYGGVWILFLNANGTVKAHQKINKNFGNFNGTLNSNDQISTGLAYMGDMDGDNVPELAVGAPGDDDGTPNDGGAVWLMRLQYVIEVQNTTPANGTHANAVGTNLSATFNENVNAATVSSTTFTAHSAISGQLLAAEGAWSAAGATVTINPTADFKPGDLIQVSATPGIQNGDTNPAFPHVWQFRTAVNGGTGMFGSPQDITTLADNAYSVHAADIDGDGDLDVLSASRFDDRIAWYENGNSWSRSDISTTADGARSVFAADIDGDGDLDVLSASETDHKIIWYENGNAWNATSISPFAVAGATAVTAADIDGDGDMDILSSSMHDDKIAWYENGNGWNKTTIWDAADFAMDVHAADLDNDGDLDVLSASSNDNCIAWYEQGVGNDWTYHDISTTADGAMSVTTADIDGDGDLDVLSASFDDNKIAWYENGNSWTQTDISTSANGAYDVFTGDVDGDGDLDVLSAASGHSRVDWYENGNSWNATEITNTAAGVTSVFAADLDDDGDLDVLSASPLDNRIAWYENTNPLEVQSVSPANGTHSGAVATDVSATFNQNINAGTVTDATFVAHTGFGGKLLSGEGAWSGSTNTATLNPNANFHPGEMVQMTVTNGVQSAGGSASAPYVWQFRTGVSSGYGSFGSQIEISTSADDVTDSFAADLDGDGDLDVISTFINLSSGSGDDDKLVWYENGNLWDAKDISSAVIRPECVFAADIDNDGDLDVLSASNGDDKIAWHENGNAWAQTVISANADYAQSVYAADLDGDGDLDVLSASRDDNKIAWYENGNGWTETVISTSAGFAQSVFAADVDGDGDMDVLSGCGSDKIAWYENGNGWAENPISTSADYVKEIYAADLDNDGDVDVLSASYNDNKIAWYENGNAWAETAIADKPSTGAWSVHAADTDGDGDLDVLSCSRDDDAVYHFENGNSWNETEVTTATNGPKSVLAADIDKDGDLDVLSASSGDDKVAWYPNAPPLEVQSTSPANASHSGVMSTDVTATFNQNVDASTVSDATFVAHTGYGGQILPAEGSWSSSTNTATLNPNTDFYPGELVQMTVTTGMKSSQGVRAVSHVWQFRTAVNGGTGEFGSEQIVTTGADGASSVYSADIDGDGDLDLLSSSIDDAKVAWYENGNGWAETEISTSALNVYCVHAADLDGDGDVDVLSASGNDDKIAWYENGNGWNETAITTSADEASSVYTADIDGDGDLDVLSASMNDNKIAWYENGNGWAETEITTSATGAVHVRAADLDGDGDQDVVAASQFGNKITWFENGNSWNPTDISTTAGGPTCVQVADLDNDGDPDVVTASESGDKIVWYENGNGWAEAEITTAVDGPRNVYTADLDNDGDMDILSASMNDDKIAWYENGNNWNQTVISTDGDSPPWVHAADIDGDGDLDVCSASYLDDKIAWYQNDPLVVQNTSPVRESHTGSITTDVSAIFDREVAAVTISDATFVAHSDYSGRTLAAEGTWSGSTNTATLNPNTDFYPGELIQMTITEGLESSLGATPEPYVWQFRTAVNGGSGEFGTEQIITTGADGASSVYSADIDGDGDLDILSSSMFDAKIAWYENGNGWAETEITTSALNVYCVHAADLDGDGDVDVMSASSNDDKIAWYENGNAWNETAITTGADEASSVYTADIDGDGDLDVLSASMNDNKIAWYENGNGWAETEITTSATGAVHVRTADLDGDGDQDVVVASQFGNKITWFENGNSWNPADISTTAGGPTCVQAADMDNDGDADVVSASYDGDKISWYENGNGWAEAEITTAVDGPRNVYTADLDNDGDLDILSASMNDNKIAWYENGNNWNQTEISTIADSPPWVHAADLDGDGDLDVCSASHQDDKIAWYENEDAQLQFVRLITPNGGESIRGGARSRIDWTSNPPGVGTIDIFCSTDGGQTYPELIGENLPNNGFHIWDVMPVNSQFCRIKVEVKGGLAASDISDMNFTIDSTPPNVNMTRPTSGQTWSTGLTYDITWNATDNFGFGAESGESSANREGALDQTSASGPISIQYSFDNWTTDKYYNIAQGEENDGLYTWTVPMSLLGQTIQIKVRAVDRAGNVACGHCTGDIVIVAPPEPILITSPNGGETFAAGSDQTITWSSNASGGQVDLYYSMDGGYSYPNLITEDEVNDGSFYWTVPDINTQTLRIKAILSGPVDQEDVSDSDLTIDGLAPTVELTSPNTGLTIEAGGSVEVTWTAQDNFNLEDKPISLFYSTDGGATFPNAIAQSEENDGKYTWNVPTDLNSSKVRLRVEAVDRAGLKAFSSSKQNMMIAPLTLALTYPNGGEVFQGGSTKTITWASTLSEGTVTLRYTTDGGKTWPHTIATGQENNGSFDWTLPGLNSQNVGLKITLQSAQVHEDQSNSAFTIDSTPPSIVLQSFTGGDSVEAGGKYEIQWNAEDNFGLKENSIILKYSDDGGLTYPHTIIEDLANNSTYTWTTPKHLYTDKVRLKIEIQDEAGHVNLNVSSSSFTIMPLIINITQPNGGELWNGMTLQTIKWTSNYNSGFVTLKYSTNGGQTWPHAIASGLENKLRKYDWEVPQINAEQVSVKAELTLQNQTHDESDHFEIQHHAPEVTIIYPVGGETWEANSTNEIRWTAEDSHFDLKDSPINILFSKDGGKTFNDSIAVKIKNDSLLYWTTPRDLNSSEVKIKVEAENVREVKGYDVIDENMAVLNPPPVITAIPDVSFENTGAAYFDLDPYVSDNNDRLIDLTWSGWCAEPRIEIIINNENKWCTIIAREITGLFDVILTATDPWGDSASDTLQIDVSGPTSVQSAVIASGPTEFVLEQNVPNPFNPQTTLRYGLPEDTEVQILVFNMAGMQVAELYNGHQSKGYHSVVWHALDQPSGVYFIRMMAGDFHEMKKCVLMK